MEWVTIIGFFAAISTTVAFLPQVIKATKSRNTKDISLWMYLLFIIGILSWLTYGILLKEAPIIVANTATILLAGWVLILKIRYG